MSDDGPLGHQGLAAGTSEFAATELQIKRALSKLRTNVPVKIVNVEDDPKNPGHHLLSVVPLTNQVDGLGRETKHGEVHGIRVLNVSGGNGMAYVKPKKGDMGIMAVADRDMGRVVEKKDQANPATGRMHDLSQGVYLGGFSGMNGTPPQSVTFDENGVTLKSDKLVKIEAPKLRVQGAIEATGEITAKVDGPSVTLTQHRHAGSPPPDPGT